jgi:hypothetical protein
VTDVSPAAQDAVLRDRALEMMKAMGSRAFTRTYFDKDDVQNMPKPQQELARKLTELQSLLAERAKARRSWPGHNGETGKVLMELSCGGAVRSMCFFRSSERAKGNWLSVYNNWGMKTCGLTFSVARTHPLQSCLVSPTAPMANVLCFGSQSQVIKAIIPRVVVTVVHKVSVWNRTLEHNPNQGMYWVLKPVELHANDTRPRRIATAASSSLASVSTIPPAPFLLWNKVGYGSAIPSELAAGAVVRKQLV